MDYKVDMDNILPVDPGKVAKETVEGEKNEEEIIDVNDDATMKAASAPFATELSPSVHLPRLPGAYHVAPSLREVATAPRGRASLFNRTLIHTYTEDHHDDSATILVPTASIVQENEIYTGSIVKAAPWEDPIAGSLEAVNSSNNPLPKDAVWIGKKRVRIYLFLVFVVIAGLVTGLTIALIHSQRDQEEDASESLSGFNDSEAPSPAPSPSRPLQEQLMAYTHSPSPSPSYDADDQPDGVEYRNEDVDDSHDSGTVIVGDNSRSGSGESHDD